MNLRSLNTSSRRALTLTEVLVAMTISLVLIGSVAAAFIQIIRASDEAEAVVRANNSSRSAVDRIAQELRTLQLDQDSFYHQFQLTDRPLTYGDNIDNDQDSAIDEEAFDGLDNDSDWTPANDRHATIGSERERPAFVNAPDFGDDAVDQDVVFSADEIRFVLPTDGTLPRRMVRYYLGTFEGEENVLLRATVENPGPVPPYGTEVIEPVTFDVVSLDILAWNANNDASGPVANQPYWKSSWDASQLSVLTATPLGAPAGVPPFKLPAAFLISVAVNAERQPLADLPNWDSAARPLETVRMSTVVTVESVTQDIRYFLYLRD